MTKKVFIPAVIALVIGGIGYRSYKQSHQPPAYETVVALRGDLVRTVEATGKIESINGVSLRFDVPGTLTSIVAKEGVSVKAGTFLANLRLGELNAAVAQAQANLNQKLAGATPEDTQYYTAAVASAKATADQSEVDVEHTTQDTAVVLQATLSKLDDALTQADNILGIDSVFVNDSFERFLASTDESKLVKAKADYVTAKQGRSQAREAIMPLTLESNTATVRVALSVALNSLSEMNLALLSVSDVLRVTTPVDVLTPTLLDTKKTTIETTRATVTAQYTILLSQKQALADAENAVKIKESAYTQAIASLDSKVNPPREVDVATYRAALAQAFASRDKAVLRAPFAGLITKVNKKIGESVNSSDVVVEILSPHYEIKVDVPETDVPKLQLNNQAQITLDAFGEDTKFQGTITAIDPSSTEVQDVVYYTVTVSLIDTAQPIKPGMTANVSIMTGNREKALIIPIRTVRTRDDGSKYVRVLENDKEKEVVVKLGLKGDEGKVEILNGINEGDLVILSSPVAK